MNVTANQVLKSVVCAVCGGELVAGSAEYRKQCYFVATPHDVGTLRTTTYGAYHKVVTKCTK